jgi:hypothetical protein
MDPYREMSQAGTCPRCGNPTEGDGEQRLTCLAGCGEWYPREVLQERWALVTAIGARAPAQPWPFMPAKCPMCSAEMQVGYREEVRYDYCGNHGVWLDSGEIYRFAQVFKLT